VQSRMTVDILSTGETLAFWGGALGDMDVGKLKMTELIDMRLKVTLSLS
jgi:hypothetical protein